MSRLLLIGAGGAAANAFARCLAETDWEIIGANCDPYALEQAECDERHLLPSDDVLALAELVRRTKPDVAHSQPDEPVLLLSELRRGLAKLGCKVYLPKHEVLELCQDKWASYEAWALDGVPVPKTHLVGRGARIPVGYYHYRPRRGAGGKGSFRAELPEAVSRMRALGEHYTAAEVMPGPTVTWQTIWHKGKLIAAQGRERLQWTDGDRGSCLVGRTCSHVRVAEIGTRAIEAVDGKPHGVYGVDMVYDAEGNPRVTEINCGRFFTTIDFFAAAGFNMPLLYLCLAQGYETEEQMLDPLEDGLLWVRAMDKKPVLTSEAEVAARHGGHAVAA